MTKKTTTTRQVSKAPKAVEEFAQAAPAATSQSDRVLVVIPYFAGGAQGRELEYAVAGWKRHFKEPMTLVVVGDHNPAIEADPDVTFIHCERVEEREGQYRPHLDFVKKFKAVRAAFPESKEFVFVADDCYAVNDFDMSDVRLLKMQEPEIRYVDFPFGGFPGDKSRTRKALEEAGLPIRSFTVHVPQCFEWAKLEALWEKYDMEHVSYVFEDLYYNTYFQNRVPLRLEIKWDNIKCGVYRSTPNLDTIRKAFKTKIWIQNGVEGWIPELDKMLHDYYFPIT